MEGDGSIDLFWLHEDGFRMMAFLMTEGRENELLKHVHFFYFILIFFLKVIRDSLIRVSSSNLKHK